MTSTSGTTAHSRHGSILFKPERGVATANMATGSIMFPPIPTRLAGSLERASGIHGQWIYVDPAARLSMIKLSSQPIPADDHLDELNLDIFR